MHIPDSFCVSSEDSQADFHSKAPQPGGSIGTSCDGIVLILREWDWGDFGGMSYELMLEFQLDLMMVLLLLLFLFFFLLFFLFDFFLSRYGEQGYRIIMALMSPHFEGLLIGDKLHFAWCDILAMVLQIDDITFVEIIIFEMFELLESGDESGLGEEISIFIFGVVLL